MEDTAVRIFWAADSTVQTNDITTYPQTGIGQVFSLYTREGVVLSNHAKNGRSTKSFMDEGRLAVIEGQIGAGDFLFIQFGHNDEKREDPARYTEPFSTFMENLETYINAARKHHAHPVLITPLERRCFVDARHLGMGAHSDYVAAMKQTAEKNRVPLVDLYSMSRCALKSAGEPQLVYVLRRRSVQKLSGGQDGQHTSAVRGGGALCGNDRAGAARSWRDLRRSAPGRGMMSLYLRKAA